MRIDPSEYQRLALRAHTLLGDVPLHDVWAVDLPGGGLGRTIEDCRAMISMESLAASNPAVRLLFGLRRVLGRVFGWDRDPRAAGSERSDGPFREVYTSHRESILEAHNATVHAFLVYALDEQPEGYRLYWAVYVKPVGGITRWYMALIDPFRRFIIYPAILRRIRTLWLQQERLREQREDPI